MYIPVCATNDVTHFLCSVVLMGANTATTWLTLIETYVNAIRQDRAAVKNCTSAAQNTH